MERLSPGEEAATFVAPRTGSESSTLQPETEASSAPIELQNTGSEQSGAGDIPPVEPVSTPEAARPGDWYANRVQEMREKQSELGSGVSKTVFVSPEREDQVRAIYHRPESQQTRTFQERYYSGKLLHMLYPDNFPDIHRSTTIPATNDVERVQPVQNEGLLSKAIHRFTDGFTRTQISRKVWKETGLVLDKSKLNFIRDKSGNLVYVDTPVFSLDMGRPSLLKKISELPPAQQAQAQVYLDRISAYVITRNQKA